MNAFLEPIRDRRKALDKDPKLVWDMLEAGNAKSPAPGPRGIWMRSKKAELYLLEKAGRCLRRRGLSPRTPDLENNDACWRAKPRARAFPQARFQRGSAPLAARRHSSSLLLNVYATVACRRRLQKAPRRIHERLPRTHSRPAQGLGQTPSSSGTCSKPATPKPAPGPRGIWMRSRKS